MKGCARPHQPPATLCCDWWDPCSSLEHSLGTTDRHSGRNPCFGKKSWSRALTVKLCDLSRLIPSLGFQGLGSRF